MFADYNLKDSHVFTDGDPRLQGTTYIVGRGDAVYECKNKVTGGFDVAFNQPILTQDNLYLEHEVADLPDEAKIVYSTIEVDFGVTETGGPFEGYVMVKLTYPDLLLNHDIWIDREFEAETAEEAVEIGQKIIQELIAEYPVLDGLCPDDPCEYEKPEGSAFKM